MGNRKWVPEVLWKVFKDKARPLSETIISLIPQNCDCRARGRCLRCIFGNGDEVAMSYLIRPDDPSDYKQLMNTCFVVIPLDAPPLPANLPVCHRFSQLQIVDNAIQTLKRNRAATSNVICSGYEEFKLSSSIVKLVTCSAWILTLKRVGDGLMDYLLMHTLIFISVRPNAHQQAAGPPVNGLFTRFPIHLPSPDPKSSLHARYRRKRRKGNGIASICEETPCNVRLTNSQWRWSYCADYRMEANVGTNSSEVSSLLHVTEAAKPSDDCGLHRDDILEEETSKKPKVKPGKRLRMPSWQRRKRCKTMMPQETCTQKPSTKTRKRGNGNASICEDPLCNIPVPNGQWRSFDCASSRNEDNVGTFSSEVRSLLHVTETAKLNDDLGLHGDDIVEEQSSDKLKVKTGKRLRLPSWRRRKRRKTLMLQDTCTQEPSTKLLTDDDNLHKTGEHGIINYQSQSDMMPTSDKHLDIQDGADLKSKQLSPLLCPCCSVFQLLSPVPKDAQIKRKSMFYSMQRSSSLFLKKHAIYSLSSGFAGATDLLRHIMGLSSIDTINLPRSCFHSHGLCSQGSPCLYHSLVKLLKDLLRRAKRCQHIKLLKKHCPIQSSSQSADRHAGCVPQSSKMEGKLANCKQVMSEEVTQPTRRSLHTELRDCKRTSEVIQRQFGLSQPYCLKDDVLSFVWAVCRNIIPPDLLGVPSNRRILRRNISRFIKLRLFEKFSLKQCMHKLEVSKVPVLSNKGVNASVIKRSAQQINGLTPQNLKQFLLENWIFWFFSRIVVPLVQANFYVTESENGKQNLYYYRKSVWKKLRCTVMKRLKDQNYQSLNYASLRSILNERSFGFSKVRLCPKETGARPIANLKAPSRLHNRGSCSHAWFQQQKGKGQSHKRIYFAKKYRRKVSYFKAVNTILRDLHVVFKDIRMKEPEKWGSSVSSYNDIYRKLWPFMRSLKEGQEAMPIVYIVVSDVQKAFDTVDQDKLLTVLNEIQMADKYTLQKSSEIFCRKKFLWISENLKLVTQDSETKFADIMPSVCQKKCHTVLVNQEHRKVVKREEIKFILGEHLKRNVLKIGQSFFLQILGIPQGSVLSSLLCSLYYGHLERNIIFPLIAKGANDMLDRDDNSASALKATDDASSSSANAKYLLLRFVDDFLFLSTSKKQAASYFSRLHRGFREYNCYMNQEKFCTNFEVGCMLGLDSKRLIVGSEATSFLSWSGLLINSYSLEVQADYTRYLNDHLSSTLTVSWQGRPGRQLKAKLCVYMRPKCHPIFFDTAISSPATIRLNVYQAFMVCAMKFHCYVRELSTWCKLHPRACLTSIQGSMRYMYNLMKRRMYSINRNSNRHNVLKLTKEEVTWLGLTAYVRVLKKKQSRYKELLSLLRVALKPLSGTGCSSELKYAVDDSYSSLLWKIKY